MLFKPADILLAVFFLVCGFAISFLLTSGSDQGSDVTVTVDGKQYAVYPLDRDSSYKIKEGGNINVLEVSGGSVRMSYANCKGHDCMNEGSISRSGETIVCLPHRLVIEVTNGQEDVDGISR